MEDNKEVEVTQEVELLDEELSEVNGGYGSGIRVPEVSYCRECDWKLSPTLYHEPENAAWIRHARRTGHTELGVRIANKEELELYNQYTR